MHFNVITSINYKENHINHTISFNIGELYEDNTKMLMSNLGAQAPIMEEDEEEEYAPVKLGNETDEEKKKRLEGEASFLLESFKLY